MHQILRVCSVLAIGVFLGSQKAAAQSDVTPSGSLTLPPAATSDARALEGAVRAAFLSGYRKIEIPPGTYRFSAPAGQQEHLLFANMSDLEIDATGVVFVFTAKQRGITFDSCAGITFKGATIIRDPIPFSQGKIEAIAPDSRSLDIKVDKGYTGVAPDAHLLMTVFDSKTRYWKPNTWQIQVGHVDPLGPGEFRVKFNLVTPPSWVGPIAGDPLRHNAMPIAVGDPIAWRGQVILDDLRVSHCKKMNLVGITVKNGAGYCFYEFDGEGDNHYTNCALTYGPKPEGADENPLLSSNADAFHSQSQQVGPTLEKCSFQGMDDDGVAIHGWYGMVMSSTSQNVILDFRRIPHPKKGERLRFLDDRWTPIGEATVIDLKEIGSYTRPANFPPLPHSFTEADNPGRYYEVQLDKAVALKPGELFSAADAVGSGFVVRDCTMRNGCARGVIVKADDGIISGCTVENTTLGGMAVFPEGSWNEAGCSHNIRIVHNTFRNGGTWNWSKWAQAGALSVGAYEGDRFLPAGAVSNIVIEDNIFDHNNGVNLEVTSTHDATIRRNRFVNPMEEPSQRGRSVGVDAGALIWMANSSGVTMEDNVLINPGHYLQSKVAEVGMPAANWKDAFVDKSP